jgi:hypothetical protein
MLFGSIRAQVREHFTELKKIAMAIGGALITIAVLSASFIPLFALVHRPQHPVIQHNLDRYHNWINYGETVPRMDSFQGIKSAIPIGKGDGWINRLQTPRFIFNPNFILEYNGCLTRSLYTTHWFPGFHSRVSVCPHPPYNLRVGHTAGPSEAITIDIRKFGSNLNGDVKSTDRGIALSWNEYVSLVKNFKWIEAYYIHNGRYDFPDSVDDPNKRFVSNTGQTILGLDTSQGIDVLYRNSSSSSANISTVTDGQANPVGSVTF